MDSRGWSWHMHCEGSLCHAILFFFSNGAGGLRVISFKIEKKGESTEVRQPLYSVQLTQKVDSYKRKTTRDHAPRTQGAGGIDLSRSSLSLDAPAMHQRAHSLDTVWRSNWTLGRAPSNTQALRCFQISHVTKMMREFRPLRRSFGTDFIVIPFFTSMF
jgi:hypothetical protein